MGVTRCVCRDVPFERLLALDASGVRGLTALQEATGCGTGCGMCVPYILRALRDRQADLPVMRSVEFDAWQRAALAGTAP